jgi:hypothetical protein
MARASVLAALLCAVALLVAPAQGEFVGRSGWVSQGVAWARARLGEVGGGRRRQAPRQLARASPVSPSRAAAAASFSNDGRAPTKTATLGRRSQLDVPVPHWARNLAFGRRPLVDGATARRRARPLSPPTPPKAALPPPALFCATTAEHLETGGVGRRSELDLPRISAPATRRSKKAFVEAATPRSPPRSRQRTSKRPEN